MPELSELDKLATLLAGNTYEKPNFAEGDIYGPLAGISGGMQGHIMRGDFSTKEKLIGSLVNGIVGGSLTGLSQDYQQSARRDYNQEIINALGGGTSAVTDLSPALFDTAQNNSKLFQVNRAMREDELDSAYARDINKARDLTRIQTEAQLEMEMFKNPALRRRLEAGTEAQPMGFSPEPLSRFPDSGESLQSKFKRLQQEQLDMGIPGGAATEAASRQLEAERKALKESVDRVAISRQKSNDLNQLAATAEAGIEGAGQTGGALGPARDILSSIYAIGNDEERDQRASQALLDSIGPDIIKASRDAGSGATSDNEMRTYLSAGPSSSKTPEANIILTQKMRKLAEIEGEYGDFLDTYREETGTTYGADKYWQTYKASNPIFISTDQGTVVNPSRMPWQEFDFNTKTQGGYSEATQDRSASGLATKATAPTPPVGFEFSGKINANGDYGIRKIR